VAVYSLDFNGTTYLKNTMDFAHQDDITSGLIKAAMFGFIVALMGCYNGFNSKGGAQGVGNATTNAVVSVVARTPGIANIFQFYRTSLFCRNLGVLLGSGVNLTATLRILVDIMAVTGNVTVWTAASDRVRHGGKLSDALLASSNMPPMAIRMLRLGEETGQLPVLAGRVAEFYEAKLQRSLDRVVGIVGPLAIVTISTVVGGLIVSVMTALLSVTQLVG